ncbi:MAG TPA: DUF4010 domain-containing protein [Acidiferrobacterales bacterium]|nr:DUF4010 domain-containing protein [Acidiferrobacterales bacterium]
MPDSLGLTTEIAALTVCLLGGAVMYGYAGLAGVFYWLGARRPRPIEASGEVRVKNPFSHVAATRFGLVFALLLVVVKLAERYAPAEGRYVVAGIAGLTEVDAIALSMSEFERRVVKTYDVGIASDHVVCTAAHLKNFS